MKDFDVKRDERLRKDRTFRLNGIEFSYRPAVSPQALLNWSRMTGGEFVLRDENDKPVIGLPTPARDRDGNLIVKGGRLVPVEGGSMVLQGGEIQMLPGQPISSLTEEEALRIYNDTILAFLEDGQEQKWTAATDPSARNPVNLADLTDLIQWLFEETSGRPTGQSSSSSESSGGEGNGRTATVLTPVSPSPPAVAQG